MKSRIEKLCDKFSAGGQKRHLWRINHRCLFFFAINFKQPKLCQRQNFTIRGSRRAALDNFTYEVSFTCREASFVAFAHLGKKLYTHNLRHDNRHIVSRS